MSKKEGDLQSHAGLPGLLQVHVSCEYQSRMLFNSEDIQGGLRVKRLAKRGALKKTNSVKSAEGASVPVSTHTERGSTVVPTSVTEDGSATA